MPTTPESSSKTNVPWRAVLMLTGASVSGCVFGMIAGLLWSLVQPSRSSDALAALKKPPQGQVAEEESSSKTKPEEKAKSVQVVKLTEGYFPSPTGRTLYFEQQDASVLIKDGKVVYTDKWNKGNYSKEEYMNNGKVLATLVGTKLSNTGDYIYRSTPEHIETGGCTFLIGSTPGSQWEAEVENRRQAVLFLKADTCQKRSTAEVFPCVIFVATGAFDQKQRVFRSVLTFVKNVGLVRSDSYSIADGKVVLSSKRNLVEKTNDKADGKDVFREAFQFNENQEHEVLAALERGVHQSEKDLAAANRLWDAGKHSEAVKQYEAVHQGYKALCFSEMDEGAIYERVIGFEAKQGNFGIARSFIEDALDRGVANRFTFFSEPQARTLLEQVLKERAKK